MAQTPTTAIIEITDYYRDPNTHVSLWSTRTTTAEAEAAITGLFDMPYRLDHNQASGHYVAAPVLDDDADYQTWLDGLDWDGCPSEDGEDHEANCTWAEQRAIAEGGALPIHDGSGGLVLVEMPARYRTASGVDPADDDGYDGGYDAVAAYRTEVRTAHTAACRDAGITLADVFSDARDEETA